MTSPLPTGVEKTTPRHSTVSHADDRTADTESTNSSKEDLGVTRIFTKNVILIIIGYGILA